MIQLQPHQQRVVDEKAELERRLTGLRAFIAGTTFPLVDREERRRLMKQEILMTELAELLAERIAAFTAPELPAPGAGGADLGLPIIENDFALGKACDLSGEGTCEACQ